MGRTAVIRALVLLLALTAPVAASPSNRGLFYTGLALAPPTYLVGVSLHEGSHAVMAKLLGAKVDLVHLFPPGVDPRANKFRFGWTYVHGLQTTTDKVLFYAAPKLTDAILLGGFAALVYTDAWPHNRYGQLALTVFATGLWVDFAKDVILFSPTNDVVHVFRLWCMTGWRQIPARLVYASAVVGLGVIVARGYQRTFDEPAAAGTSPIVVPMLTGAF